MNLTLITKQPACFPGTKEEMTRPMVRAYERQRRQWPTQMTPIPQEQWPHLNTKVLGVWRSRWFLATLFNDTPNRRLTVNRTEFDTVTGQWRQGITWDDLMVIKKECGFGGTWAVEIFPPNDQMINVANMRHLWLLTEIPPYAWTRQ